MIEWLSVGVLSACFLLYVGWIVYRLWHATGV